MHTEYLVFAAGDPVADRIRMADTFFSRWRGLMGKAALADGEGLFLRNCGSIHCFFMRFPIDAVYLDKTLRIVGVETVFPWRLGHLFPGAKHVLELRLGTARQLSVGQTLEMKER